MPQTYYPRESPVHRADSRAKLLLLLLYTVCLFVVATWRGMGLLALLLALTLLASRLPGAVMARSLIPLYALMAFAVLFNTLGFNPQGAGAYGMGGVSAGVLAGLAPIPLAGGLYFLPEGLGRSLFYCARVLCMVVASLAVAYSTPATQLTAGLAWFMRPLGRLRVPVNDIALTFTLALRFIPLAFGELQQVKLAQMARGARFQVGGLWQRVSAWQPVLVPWLVALYRRAGRIAVAMDVRAYGLGERPTTLRALRFRAADAALLLGGAAACLLSCLLG